MIPVEGRIAIIGTLAADASADGAGSVPAAVDPCCSLRLDGETALLAAGGGWRRGRRCRPGWRLSDSYFGGSVLLAAAGGRRHGQGRPSTKRWAAGVRGALVRLRRREDAAGALVRRRCAGRVDLLGMQRHGASPSSTPPAACPRCRNSVTLHPKQGHQTGASPPHQRAGGVLATPQPHQQIGRAHV